MDSRRSETPNSFASTRERRRDVWLRRIIARTEKFRPRLTTPESPPILVVDKHTPTRTVNLVRPKAVPSIPGGDIFVNALQSAVKSQHLRRMESSKHLLRQLEEQQNLFGRQEQEHQVVMQRSLPSAVTEMGSKSAVLEGKIPLELMPCMHPSHSRFQGFHPFYGRGTVRGLMPEPPMVRNLAQVGRAVLRSSPWNTNVLRSGPPSTALPPSTAHSRSASTGALPSRRASRPVARLKKSYDDCNIRDVDGVVTLNDTAAVVGVDASGRIAVFDSRSGVRLVPAIHDHEPSTWRWGARDV